MGLIARPRLKNGFKNRSALYANDHLAEQTELQAPRRYLRHEAQGAELVDRAPVRFVC
jgi:hypothetical protein